ncbi:uncharacterized protein LOC116616597 isoform X1 [Nematostella vectensis]|uniref:uncharacterized protein LOC116616597 isoform X1 n=1 Tax=Nematostella vectensis TaxID=45351 RepID=UPI0020778336|nr:uncharacterized protein LOC116616597 isoform X1 [Nematostella vectensis]
MTKMKLPAHILNLLLTAFLGNLPTESGFAWTSVPPSPLVVFLGDNSTDVELRWDFDLQMSKIFYARLELLDSADSRTKVHIKNMQPGEVGEWTSSYFLLNVTIPNVEKTTRLGFVKLVIKNVEHQGPQIDVEAVDSYFYRMKIMTLLGTVLQNDVLFHSYRKPTLLSYPSNHTVRNGTSVRLECHVKGKPTPIITWTKFGSPQWLSSGSVANISNVTTEDRGIYVCTASNGIGTNVTAVSLVQYTGCTVGCVKKEVGIQLTEMQWTDRYSHQCIYNPQINNLKSTIEYEIFREYIKASVGIYLVEVTRFRRGSVVAAVSLHQPGNVSVDVAPLLKFISSGHLAGHRVNSELVSPSGTAWARTPITPFIVLLGENATDIKLRWDFDLQEDNLQRVNLELLNTAKKGSRILITGVSAGHSGRVFSNSFYYVDVNIPTDSDPIRLGYMQLTVRDVLEQGVDGNGNKIEVEKFDSYVYRMEVKLSNGQDFDSRIPLLAYMRPKLLSYPSNYTITQIGSRVTLTCEVRGIPTPNITWSKLGDPRLRSTGSTFTISGFTVEDRGIYVCTASNGIGTNVTAVSLVQYIGCSRGCTKREVDVRFTRLQWTANYSRPDLYTPEIRDLKDKIEYEIVKEYLKINASIYACQVTLFRPADGVIAMVTLLHPGDGVYDEPLNRMIKSGFLAGQIIGQTTVNSTPPIAGTHDSRPCNCSCDVILIVCTTIIAILTLLCSMLFMSTWRALNGKIEPSSRKSSSDHEENTVVLTLLPQGSTMYPSPKEGCGPTQTIEEESTGKRPTKAATMQERSPDISSTSPPNPAPKGVRAVKRVAQHTALKKGKLAGIHKPSKNATGTKPAREEKRENKLKKTKELTSLANRNKPLKPTRGGSKTAWAKN